MFAQNVPPIGELFASDANSSSAMQLAGSGMSVYSGSELSAGIAPATLKLARGGQVRICPNSGLNVTASGQGLMLATGAGALEIEYELKEQAADVVITPDFNVALVGPGTFHFALGISKKGDTCVKPLPGNESEITFSELLGTGVYKASPDQTMLFRSGKLDGKTALTGECGCPPAAPVMHTEAQPIAKPLDETPKPAQQVAVSTNETSPLPPDKPGQVHIQVDTPFVFSARPGAGRPYAVAKVQFSSLPNVYFVQERVDPVVLIEKKPEVSAKPSTEASKPEEKPRKEKKGFMGRVKGFFGSLFHR
ncbi:MAG TPA: hypothetical protein VN658_05685 [Candidatus Acidoferrales bacterium]|nr:hypothetical protein [Candidatus Acidoferrales bacterium]